MYVWEGMSCLTRPWKELCFKSLESRSRDVVSGWGSSASTSKGPRSESGWGIYEGSIVHVRSTQYCTRESVNVASAPPAMGNHELSYSRYSCYM